MLKLNALSSTARQSRGPGAGVLKLRDDLPPRQAPSKCVVLLSPRPYRHSVILRAGQVKPESGVPDVAQLAKAGHVG